jgi:cell division protein FtsL
MRIVKCALSLVIDQIQTKRRVICNRSKAFRWYWAWQIDYSNVTFIPDVI